MYSTWTDNDHNDSTQRRIESATKRPNGNRIQVVSKIAPGPDRNQVDFKFNNTNNININNLQQNVQYMNHTCVDRTERFPARRVNTTTEELMDKSERDKNILKLMQQQLELAKNNYEQKIKNQLKESSIELSKLKIKLQNNTELLASKDQLIQQLKSQIRKGSPTKSAQNTKSNPSPALLSQKMNDVEARFTALIDNQNKLGQKIYEIGSKVELVQKGLIGVFACKISNIQTKLNEFLQVSNQKLNILESNLASKFKKQLVILPNNSQKTTQGQSCPQFQPSIQPLFHKMQSLRQEIMVFKNKQFRYQNSNIVNLKKDINDLRHVIGELQKKFYNAQNRLRASKCSSRKNYDSDRRNTSINISSYFDDYEEVYQDVDSIGQDQFFHPLELSAKKFAQQSQQSQQSPMSKPSRPTHPSNAHNDSFQNFTSDQQQQQSPNQKRLINTLRAGGYKLPLPIQFDLTGYLRKKIDQKYLVDNEKKGFFLTANELKRCKNKGWVI